MLIQTLFCQLETKLLLIDRSASDLGKSWGNTEKRLISVIMLSRERKVSKALKGWRPTVLGGVSLVCIFYMVFIALSVLC